jgi:hypothetical protein
MNWCLNILSITGSSLSLGKFECENRDEKNNLSFEKSVPLSHYVKTRSPSIDDEDVTDMDFDEEAVKTWGCGWDCYCYELETKDTYQYVYEFDTLMTPPIGWLERVSLKYPDLEFDMVSEEFIQDYSIHIKIKNGVRIFYENLSYQKKHYELLDGDRLAIQLLDMIRDHKTFYGFMYHGRELLDMDDERKKEEIEMILDENEAYDFLEYLQKRMRELYR